MRVSRGTSRECVEVRLSSWAKEACYQKHFGVHRGRPVAIRRPRFLEGAREGLVYFLPRTMAGDIVVGVCLQKADLEALRMLPSFRDHAQYIG